LKCPLFLTDALTKISQKDLMEQQQHGFSDSTPRAGSDRLQKTAKIC